MFPQVVKIFIKNSDPTSQATLTTIFLLNSTTSSVKTKHNVLTSGQGFYGYAKVAYFEVACGFCNWFSCKKDKCVSG